MRPLIYTLGFALLAARPALAAAIDHVVVWTDRLDQGGKQLGQLLGARPGPGGSHPGRGTRNELLSLGPGTYLELLGPDEGQAAPRRRTGARPPLDALTFVVANADLDRIAERARAMGLSSKGPVEGSRSRPDGSVISWKSLELEGHAYGGLVPSFVTWLTPQHPSASAPAAGTLARLTAVHPDARALGALYRALDVPATVAAGPAPALLVELDGANGRTLLIGTGEGF